MKGFLFLLKYVWKEKKQYVLYQLMLQVLTAVVPLVDITVPKFIIDELTGAQRIDVITQWILCLLFVSLVGSILISFIKGKVFLLRGEIYTQFQTEMTERISKCDFERLEDPHFLNMKQKAEQFLYANGQGFAVVLDCAFGILGNLFTFIGIVAIVASLDFWVPILFIVLISINAFFDTKVRERIIQWDLEKAPVERRTRYLTNLIEDFAFGKEIRIFGFQEWLVSKVQSHLLESNQFYSKQIRLSNRINYIAALTSVLLKGITYAFLGASVLRKTISLGDFTMYTGAMLSFSSSMQSLMKSLVDIRQYGGYYEVLQEYMDVPKHMLDGKQLPCPSAPYQIRFDNVSFHYPGQDQNVLHNIDLVINSGEKLSVVGENGAGKTTFVKLLCRLYDPTQGRILLNGVDIRDIDYEEYMSIICTVFQDYKLLAFSIKENIAFQNCNNVPDNRINEILAQSGFNNKIEKLPKGIHTQIYKAFDEEGFEPSGGEGQKIALARAMYKDSPVIILDEPTSALDPRAEYELYLHFSEMTEGKTTIFISHRMSCSKFCDRIALFQNGRIQEYGTHEELMDKNGLYKSLFEMQSQYYT